MKYKRCRNCGQEWHIAVPVCPYTDNGMIARLNRPCIVTEKIDGTNAQVYVGEDGLVLAGSRSRWLSLEDDNFGFAAWAKEHEDELRRGLGPGRHYGEWWGRGIQRGYGLQDRRFSLFNANRWTEERPECCHVVPVLAQGQFSNTIVDQCVEQLRAGGSAAAPGFARPEGVVVFHVPSENLYKVTLEKDEEWKGKTSGR